MNWEIFRDGIWNFIGVIITCIALSITVIIYFLQRNKKGLSYEILSRTSLLSSKEKLEGKIKILYNNQVVQNVKFLEIKVLNTGNICIPSSDYERPLRFIFEAEANILTAEIIKSKPESLTTTLNLTQNEIIVQPILMNSKDYLVIKAIVSNFSEEDVIVDGRIKDVKDIKKQEESNKWLYFAVTGTILCTAAIVLFSIKSNSSQVEIPGTLVYTIGLSLFVIGYAFMIRILLNRAKI